jgi:hypothetical protein
MIVVGPRRTFPSLTIGHDHDVAGAIARWLTMAGLSSARRAGVVLLVRRASSGAALMPKTSAR